MECKFSVGQKVVCVNREEMHGGVQLDPVEIPQVGVIYTVRTVHVGSIFSSAPGVVGILLDEIEDQFSRIIMNGDVRSQQLYYEAANFRPLVARNTDISQFQAMLTTTKVEERA